MLLLARLAIERLPPLPARSPIRTLSSTAPYPAHPRLDRPPSEEAQNRCVVVVPPPKGWGLIAVDPPAARAVGDRLAAVAIGAHSDGPDMALPRLRWGRKRLSLSARPANGGDCESRRWGLGGVARPKRTRPTRPLSAAAPCV